MANLITLNEFAKGLDVSRRTLNRYIAEGKAPKPIVFSQTNKRMKKSDLERIQREGF